MSFFYQRMPARPWVQSLALLIFFALTVSPAAAQKSTSAPEIAEKRADLDGLRQRIDSLRKELSSNEGTRADAADRLRDPNDRFPACVARRSSAGLVPPAGAQ